MLSNWYVVFVQTGQEMVACNTINKLLSKKEASAFVPQIELIYKRSNHIVKYLKPMFPGYVFTESTLGTIDFLSYVSKILRFSKCIFYILGKNALEYMKLGEDEKKILLGFCNDGHIVEDSVGYIKGDNILITSGPLMGRESIIKKIDRHKRLAWIELDFLGDVRLIKVGLEIVSKVK